MVPIRGEKLFLYPLGVLLKFPTNTPVVMGVTPWEKGEGEATKLMEREHNTVPIHKCKTKMVFQCINYTGKYKIKLKSSKSYVCDLGNIFFAFDFVAILYLTLRCQLK